MYSLAQFESDIEAIRPRPFDTYILPVFLMGYAYKSKQMRVNARRALFVSGIYIGYRNYTEYKKLVAKIASNIPLENVQLPGANKNE